MADQELRLRFPEMRPMGAPPTLGRLNGFGAGMYGRRDDDPETGTYVSTHCVSALWIPVFPLGAYRVADAEGGGWYFIGKEPISPFARSCRFGVAALAALVLCVAAWNSHTRSPEYRARQELEDAHEERAAGRLPSAARAYAGVIERGTTSAVDARAGLLELIGSLGASVPLDDVRDVLQVAQDSGDLPESELSARTRAVASARGEADPAGAIALLDWLVTVNEAEVVVTDVETIARAWAGREPRNSEPASRLALLHEARGEWDRCEELLEPHRGRLGNGEGARILGRLDAAAGRWEQAFALLGPYVEERLDGMERAQAAYAKALERVEKSTIERMNLGLADASFYARYAEADETGKQGLVTRAVTAALEKDGEVQRTHRDLVRRAGVVPVALDVATVRLRRAQSMATPAARAAELQGAEDILLAIRGVAGDTVDFQLTRGQVAYWMGRPEEGRRLLDGALDAGGRSPELLLGVGDILKHIGAHSEARALFEEAFEKAPDTAVQQAAAAFRASIHLGADDQLLWLRRTDVKSPSTQASLEGALGSIAVRQGDLARAESHHRKALEIFETLPDSSTVRNNAALVSFELHGVTGDVEDYATGVRNLEAAAREAPANAVVAINLGASRVRLAVLRIVSGDIALRQLRVGGQMDLLAHLYRDESGRAALGAAFRDHEQTVAAIPCLERAILLSPRERGGYWFLGAIHGFTRNAEGLRTVLARLNEADLDLEQPRREFLEFLEQGADEDELQAIRKSIESEKRILETLRKGGHARTRSVAATNLAMQLISAHVMGIDADPEEVVRLAEEAVAAHESHASLRTLVHAYLFQAHVRGSAGNTAYGDVARKHPRVLPPSLMVALVLMKRGPLQEALAASSDVQRAVKMLADLVREVPRGANSWDWAILRNTDPDAAAEVARVLRTDEVGLLDRDIDANLNPHHTVTAITAALHHRIAGDEAGAAAALKRCRDLGGPIPEELLE